MNCLAIQLDAFISHFFCLQHGSDPLSYGWNLGSLISAMILLLYKCTRHYLLKTKKKIIKYDMPTLVKYIKLWHVAVCSIAVFAALYLD